VVANRLQRLERQTELDEEEHRDQDAADRDAPCEPAPHQRRPTIA
jgi:hypothetical protein